MFRFLAMFAALSIATLTACDTQPPDPDPDTAADVATGLRAAALVIGVTTPPPGVEDTPALCVVRLSVSESLNSAADEVAASPAGPAALPELSIPYGYCLAVGADDAPDTAADAERVAGDVRAALEDAGIDIEHPAVRELISAATDAARPLDDIEPAVVLRVLDAAAAVVELTLQLGSVRERDCVGYEIGVGVRDWVLSDLGGALVSELTTSSATGVLEVPRRPLRYDTCEASDGADDL